MGTAPLGGLESDNGAKMILLAFRDAGSHLTMGHPEAKLLFLPCKPLLCCASPCLECKVILLSTYNKRSTHRQHVRPLTASWELKQTPPEGRAQSPG